MVKILSPYLWIALFMYLRTIWWQNFQLKVEHTYGIENNGFIWEFFVEITDAFVISGFLCKVIFVVVRALDRTEEQKYKEYQILVWLKDNVNFSAFRMSDFVNFFLWALDTLHSPPETGRFIEHEQLLFDRQTSLLSGDAFFLKLRLKLLDLDLTISDRTIILISALFLFVSFHKNLCLL